jgi:hypothetical protein
MSLEKALLLDSMHLQTQKLNKYFFVILKILIYLMMKNCWGLSKE